jgi:ATP-dependent Clp protease ATP-binding subunit ClpA
MNRLDHIVVFRSLGTPELRRIIDIEFDIVQQRIGAAAQGNPFSIHVTASAKEFLLSEGTDVRYGARPLKRAIERLLVHPLSNLMATGQIRRGDYIRVSHAQDAPGLLFSRETTARQAWGVGCEAA